MNTVECAEMDNAARRNGVKLMEAFMYRFHPQTQKVVDLVQSGAIGKLRLIHSALTVRITDSANIRLQVDLGGGSLMDVGCYCVNISRTVARQEPVEVQAFAEWGSSGVDEQMLGTLRFGNGLLAQFDCSLILSRRDFYQLVGTEGTIDVPAAFVPGTSETTIRVKKGSSEQLHHVEGVDEYRLMVEHFANCVLSDEPLRYPATEAAGNMRVIEALYRSARHGGKPEKVPSS
jgi:predicted dehydrogenase